MFSRSVLFSAEGGKKRFLRCCLPSQPISPPFLPFPHCSASIVSITDSHGSREFSSPLIDVTFQDKSALDYIDTVAKFCFNSGVHELCRDELTTIARDLEKLDSIIDCSFKGCIIDDFVLGVVKTHSCASWSSIYYV